jgi:enoyl-CoA hydratase
MNFQTLLFEHKGFYALITLNRPDKLNALNATLLQELGQAAEYCRTNPEIRAVIITGAGPKAFAAGADIAQLHEQNADTGADFARLGQKVFTALEFLGKPVIAAVNGFALGGGCELAMACHIRFASENARFGQPEINLGIIPGYGGTQRLTRLIGTARATELILSGTMINAAEANRIGLVNSVHPQEELLDYTIKFAESITTKAPLALYSALACVQAANTMTHEQGMEFEAREFGRICGTEDFKEGTKAFLEKRTASFQGR